MIQNIAIVAALMIWTNFVNLIFSYHSLPPPYWKDDYFLESELPDSLKGKPINYIDSVFKVNRKAQHLP